MKKLNSYLTFKLGNELFAANVGHVLHILGIPEITQMPNAPDYVMGVMNLRGQVLPVIDPHNETFQLGSLVDSVQKVIEIDNKQILPPPDLGTEYNANYIEGVIHEGDKFILILNITQVFSELSSSINL